MKRLACFCMILVGCSGPIALNRAIKTEHRSELAGITAMAPGNAKAAWFKWKAKAEGVETGVIQTRDEALSATKNPFDARRDADAVSRGALIYEANCMQCHGTDARGKGKLMPAEDPCRDFHAFDMRFAVTLHGGAPRSWFKKVSEGYTPEANQSAGRKRAMPAFNARLAREQIWLAITYLQSLDADAEPATE